jgi:hypothetical protein
MIIRTGRDGKSCADAGTLKPTAAAKATVNAATFNRDPTKFALPLKSISSRPCPLSA